jgi:hypothetical protein
MEELRALVLAGPELERNKVVRWRCADLRTEIASRWPVTVTEGTVGRLLRRLGITRLQPRRRWRIEAGGAPAPGVSTFGVHYVTRTESGLATRIMRFNASTTSATSPC